MNRDRLIYICLGLAISWLVASCGKTARQAPELDTSSAVRHEAELSLPRPSALRGGSFAALDLLAWGNEFDPSLPHNNVTAFTQQASYYPHANSPGTALERAAYAVYRFKIPDYSFDATLHLDLGQAQDFADAWLALADFSRDCWEWLPVPPGGVINFDPARHFSPGWDLYAVPLFTGNHEWYLRAIRIGTVQPPQILSVQPQAGLSGTTVTLIPEVIGTAPFNYHWYGMDFATPNESFAVAPTVTLGTPGQYSYYLRIENSAGDTGLTLQSFTVLPPDTSWQHSWGGAGNDKAHDVAVDTGGNVYVVGESASVDDNGAAVILRYSAAGDLQWARGWDGPGGEAFDAIAIDQDGNLLVVGWTYSFGEGQDDILLVKYAPDGTLLSQRTWGGAGRDSATGLALDSAGNAYICAKSDSFVTYGHYGVLLLKFDAAQTFQWAWAWGGEQSDEAEDVAVDSLSHVYVAGISRSFGGAAFVLKCDGAGTMLLQKTWANMYPGEYHFHGLAVDGADNVYAIGDMPDGDISDDPVVIKYDANLDSIWTRQWRGSAAESGRGIVVDGTGTVYTTGTTWSRGPSDTANLFLMVIDAAGSMRRASAWGIAESDARGAWKLQEGRAIALMPDGEPVMAGSCENTYAVWEPAGSVLLDATGFEYHVAGSITLDANIDGVEGTAAGAVDTLLTGYTQDTGYATIDFAVIKADP